ncbi:HNH endonuclease [Acinetobacter sp. c2-A9]|uniref:HNH endonuclease n=2 Tax=unclassified Acinetobacter TaxID=196816 RepID=UPI0035B8C8B5
MGTNLFINKLIERFEIWWQTDVHRENMDIYDGVITKNYLKSLSDNDFLKFFYDFVAVGGKLQSGGERTKNLFKKNLKSNLKSFREFILLPFNENFSLKEWFEDIKNYPYFGIGIATIYLNRVDRYKFPVMNNKTLQALSQLGYPVSSSKSWDNYSLVFEIQKSLMNNYKTLNNFYKVDSLNHFIIAIEDGQTAVREYQKLIKNFYDEQEVQKLSLLDDVDLDYQALLDKINKYSAETAVFVQINGRRYKRYNYLMSLIKQCRGYKCQFCDISIPVKDNGFYIETCHINPKSKQGSDSLSNILTLCPNCHKIFDLNDRLDEEHSEDRYQVTIQGTRYSVNLK